MKNTPVKNFVGVGVAIGVLAGIWAELATPLGLLAWVGFLAWACYYAAGTGKAGLYGGGVATVAGALWSWVAVQALSVLTFPGALGIVVALLALVLCLQAAVEPLAFIPGAFAGAAAFFGNGDLWVTVASLVIGLAGGFLSALLAGRIQAVVDHQGSGTAPRAASAA